MKITFTGGSRVGEQVNLDENLESSGSVMFGRSHACDIHLIESDISGRHMEIYLDVDGVCTVCHSNWGFKLNGEVVGKGEHHALKTGDVVVLGSRVSFRVEDDRVANNGGGVTDEELDEVRKLIVVDEIGKAMGLLRGMLAKDRTNIQIIVLHGMCHQIRRGYADVQRIQDILSSMVLGDKEKVICDEVMCLAKDWLDDCKIQAEIKQILVDGGAVKARVALKELLTKNPKNLFAKILLGACSLLIDDEEIFKSVYNELKPVMESKEGKAPETMDALFLWYWRKYCRAFEILYVKKGKGVGQWFREYVIDKFKNKLALKSILFLAVTCVVFSATGDVLPHPRMSDFPLHRIGIEFVLTSIAGALGGGFAARWLIRRGWKFENEVPQAERYSMERKLDAALPKLLRCSVGMRLCNDLGIGIEYRAGVEHLSGIEFVLQQNSDLAKDLNGVPIEWVESRTESLYRNKKHEWYNSKSRTRYENDDLYFMGGLGLGKGYWASSEEMSEWDENVRTNWHSPSEVTLEEIVKLKRTLEARRRRRRWVRFSIIIGLILMLMGLFLLFFKKCN